MLRDIDYARQLDSMLDQVGNDQSALDKLNSALEQMPDFDEPESDPSDWPDWTDNFTWESDEDWDDYERYLDQIDLNRDTTPMTPPRFHAWLARIPLED